MSAQKRSVRGAWPRTVAWALALLLSTGTTAAAAQPSDEPAPATLPLAPPLPAASDTLAWRWEAAPAPVHVAVARRDPVARPAPPGDPWLGQDKLLHAAGSFLIALSAQYVLTQKIGQRDALAFPVSAFGTFGLGLVKEVSDGRRPVNPHFSTRDLVADAVGIALAGVVVAL